RPAVNLLCDTRGITAPGSLLGTHIKSPGAPHAMLLPRTRSLRPQTTSTHPFWCRAIRRSRVKTLPETDLDNETVTKAYARWAPIYDLVFGAVFERGRYAAIAAADRVGGRILEVGVGTGISLPNYSTSCRVCGIDISEPMLRKAQERIVEHGLS